MDCRLDVGSVDNSIILGWNNDFPGGRFTIVSIATDMSLSYHYRNQKGHRYGWAPLSARKEGDLPESEVIGTHRYNPGVGLPISSEGSSQDKNAPSQFP